MRANNAESCHGKHLETHQGSAHTWPSLPYPFRSSDNELPRIFLWSFLISQHQHVQHNCPDLGFRSGLHGHLNCLKYLHVKSNNKFAATSGIRNGQRQCGMQEYLSNCMTEAGLRYILWINWEPDSDPPSSCRRLDVSNICKAICISISRGRLRHPHAIPHTA